MVRCPFSLERIISAAAEGKVVYRAEKPGCRPFPILGNAKLLRGISRNCSLMFYPSWLFSLQSLKGNSYQPRHSLPLAAFGRFKPQHPSQSSAAGPLVTHRDAGRRMNVREPCRVSLRLANSQIARKPKACATNNE